MSVLPALQRVSGACAALLLQLEVVCLVMLFARRTTASYRPEPLLRAGHAVQAFLHSAHRSAVQHKLRVNLRPLAEVQMLLWMPGLLLLAWLGWRFLVLILQAILLPLDEQATSAAVTPA